MNISQVAFSIVHTIHKYIYIYEYIHTYKQTYIHSVYRHFKQNLHTYILIRRAKTKFRKLQATIKKDINDKLSNDMIGSSNSSGDDNSHTYLLQPNI